jgi:hypothetical protein
MLNVIKIVRVGALLMSLAGLCAAQPLLDSPLDHGKYSGSLPEVLRCISQDYRIPLIAELSQPLPVSVRVEEGRDTARELFSRVSKTVLGYNFEVLPDDVVHFFWQDLAHSSGNFLNLEFRQFTMPANVSELKLLLPAKLNGLRNGLEGDGVVTSGFGSPVLRQLTLRPEVLSNVTGRDILIKAARETKGFYCIVVFPPLSKSPTKFANYAFQHWFWGPAHLEAEAPPMYIQPPPK